MAFLTKIIVRGLQSYWRLTRGLTLVAQACLFDTDNRVALVKTGAGGGWGLPRMTVHNGEALEDALRRLLHDDLGIDAAARQDPFWMYAEVGPNSAGQTGLFVIRQWTRKPGTKSPFTFFDLDALPATLDAEDAARICQAAEGRAPFEVC